MRCKNVLYDYISSGKSSTLVTHISQKNLQLRAHMYVLWGWMSPSCIWRAALQTCTTLCQAQNNKWCECRALGNKCAFFFSPAAMCDRIHTREEKRHHGLWFRLADDNKTWTCGGTGADSLPVFVVMWRSLKSLTVNGDWLSQSQCCLKPGS